MEKGIRSIETRTGDKDEIEQVRIVFGPHYFVELRASDDGEVRFVMGATHHGFAADASEIAGELEHLIEEIRRLHPDKTVD